MGVLAAAARAATETPDAVEPLSKQLRKALTPDQWSTFLGQVLDSLHRRDAIQVLSSLSLTREMEGLSNPPRLYTETRSANMRITAAGKEPWTVTWIGDMRPGEVLYDIGANVGPYTLLALLKGLTVVAFEPHPESFRDLCRNAVLNCLQDRLIALPVGLSDAPGLASVPSVALGQTAGMTMTLGDGEGLRSILTAPLDGLIRAHALPPPTHLKIDVDGFEARVLTGARQTLAAETTKSCLIEVDTRTSVSGQWDADAVLAFLTECGLRHDPIETPMTEGVSYLRTTR